MPIPPTLLAAACQHSCFSGVFDAGNRTFLHQDPSTGPVEVVDFHCEDCLVFRLGCAASDLPQGISLAQAADLITQHVRQHRGYALSVGGYHTIISGWLSAVYWDAAGIFAIHADRGSSPRKPALDVLIQAMQLGLVKPSHPAMLDPKEYVTHDVFLSVVPPPVITNVAALLASAHVATAWKVGHHRVTLAEFLPVARGSATNAAATSAAASSASTQGAAVGAVAAVSAASASSAPTNQTKAIGERCSTCGEIVGERLLFTSTYIGCLCG